MNAIYLKNVSRTVGLGALCGQISPEPTLSFISVSVGINGVKEVELSWIRTRRWYSFITHLVYEYSFGLGGYEATNLNKRDSNFAMLAKMPAVHM